MNDSLTIADCTDAQVPEILVIFNDAIATSTAIYDYHARTPADVAAWFEAKRKGGWPVIGAFEADGALAGFASYGTFRTFPAYKYTVEHSVYVEKSRRGRGVGRRLLATLIDRARAQDLHVMIGGIDSANLASIELHRRLGFRHCASIQQAGFKFGRWLDLEFYQLILPTPAEPKDG